MTKTHTKLVLALAAVAAALFAFGAGGAAANGGRGGIGQVGTSALVNAAASQLSVTSAKLKGAILDSALARIDEAVADQDISSTDAADLKDEARDNLIVSYRLSRASTVASGLGITVTKLNDGFRAARKALILKKIDAAQTAGKITADQAAQLKAQLDKVTLPGYKPGLGLAGLADRTGAKGFRR